MEEETCDFHYCFEGDNAWPERVYPDSKLGRRINAVEDGRSGTCSSSGRLITVTAAPSTGKI